MVYVIALLLSCNGRNDIIVYRTEDPLKAGRILGSLYMAESFNISLEHKESDCSIENVSYSYEKKL